MFARLVPSAALEIITKELNIASPSENEINDFIHYHALSKGNSDACGTLLVKARLQSMEQQLQVKTAEYEVSEKAKMRLEYNLEQSAKEVSKFVATTDKFANIMASHVRLFKKLLPNNDTDDSDNGVPGSQSDGPVHEEQSDVPVHEERSDVPAHEEQSDVPAHEEQSDIPIHEEQSDVPAHEEKSDVNVVQEQGSSAPPRPHGDIVQNSELSSLATHNETVEEKKEVQHETQPEQNEPASVQVHDGHVQPVPGQREFGTDLRFGLRLVFEKQNEDVIDDMCESDVGQLPADVSMVSEEESPRKKHKHHNAVSGTSMNSDAKVRRVDESNLLEALLNATMHTNVVLKDFLEHKIVFSSKHLTVPRIKKVCSIAQGDPRWKSGPTFCLRKNWEGVFSSLNTIKDFNTLTPDTIRKNRQAFILVFFTRADDDVTAAELRCQMMVRTTWLKKQEDKLELRLAEYVEMASQPLIPVQKSKLNNIQQGARMYLNHSLIKFCTDEPDINALDMYRFMGEDPTKVAVICVQHLKPPTLWDMKMPEPILVYTTKANRHIYIQRTPF